MAAAAVAKSKLAKHSFDLVNHTVFMPLSLAYFSSIRQQGTALVDFILEITHPPFLLNEFFLRIAVSYGHQGHNFPACDSYQ
jgi:hypothetical protein